MEGIDLSDLGIKSADELEQIGVKLTGIKEQFLQDWEKAARLVQTEIVEAQAREYAIRHDDPEYAAKRQGPVPDFVKSRKVQLDEIVKKRNEQIATEVAEDLRKQPSEEATKVFKSK